jgi:chromosome segregation ATPase
MEIEQITKRLEWLDEERRKEKTTIATLEDKILRLEGGLQGVKKEIKDLHQEMAQFNTVFGRLDQLGDALAQIRVDIGRMTESIQKGRLDSEYEQEAKRRLEYDGINKSIAEIRKGLEPISELKKGLKGVQEEQKKISEQFPELDTKVMSSAMVYEEFQRSQKLLEESRKVENKRVTDLQGEVSAYRKRIDEQRGRVDLLLENLKKVETRLTDLSQSEAERRQAQVTFIERQNQAQVERDRSWKEIQSKFTTMEQTTSAIDSQIHSLDETLRTVRRAKEQMDDATQRIERRVNEITEMHRLNEDHFRQEWTAYKADDQKRWTNYNMVAEEQQKDLNRQFDKLDQRMLQLEDLTQQVSDHFDEMNEETQKRLRSLLDTAHSWLSSYERIFGKPSEQD